MSSIRFNCPHCSKPVEFSEESYGYRVFCIHCNGEILIPDRDRPPPKIAPIHPDVDNSPGTPGMPSTSPEPPGMSDPETEIFEISPMARAYAGRVFLGIVLIIAVVALSIVFDSGMLLILVLAGLFMLLDVWIKLRSSRYRLTSQRLFVRHGLIARHLDELELFRVKDVLVEQTIVARMMNIGNVSVLSSDENTPCVNIIGVRDPVEVKEVIRTHCRAARRREGMRPAELMQS